MAVLSEGIVGMGTTQLLTASSTRANTDDNDDDICDVCCQFMSCNENQEKCDLASLSLLQTVIRNKCQNSASTALIFEDHLLIYFISTQMLKVSPSQFLELSRVSPKSGNGRYINLCVDCQGVVSKAWNMFREVKKLQEKIEELGEVLLREGIHIHQSRNHRHNGSIFSRILNFLRSQLDLHVVVKEEAIENNLQSSFEDEPLDQMLEDSNWPSAVVSINEEAGDVYNNHTESEKDMSAEESGEEDEWLPGDKNGSKMRVTNISSDQSNFTCDLCGSIYMSPLTIRRHMQAHEDSKERFRGKFDCPKCKFPSLSEHSLRYHMTKVHKLSPGEGSSIKKSGAVFRNFGKCKVRIRPKSKWLKNLKDGMYQCDLCEARYMHAETIKKHMNVHDKSQTVGGKWDCELCRFPSLCEVELQKHLRYKHGAGKDHQNSKVVSRTVKMEGDDTEENLNPVEPLLFKENEWNLKDDEIGNHQLKYDSAEGTIERSNMGNVGLQSKSPHPCQLCGSIYQTRLGYRRHMEAHKESTELLGNKFDCPNCRFPALSEYKLRYHMTKVHNVTLQGTANDAVEQRQAKVCPKSKWLKNLKDGKLECDLCNARYSHPETIRKHMNIHDKSRTEFGSRWDCKLCHFPTLSETALQLHLTAKHVKDNKPMAGIIEGDINNEDLFRAPDPAAIEETGGSELDWDTDEIGKAKKNESTTAIGAVDTLVWNTLPKSHGTYPCQLCGSVYQTLLGYRRHLQAHKESTERFRNKFECTKCNFPALSEYKLRYHMTKAHNLTMDGTPHDESDQRRLRIRPNSKWLKNLKNNRFQCRICQAKYFHPETLKKHMNNHNKSKLELGGKWACNICRFPTLTDTALRKHLTSKHGGDQETPEKNQNFEEEVDRKRNSSKKSILQDGGEDSSGSIGSENSFSDEEDEWRPEDEEMDDKEMSTSSKANVPKEDQSSYPCQLCNAVYQRVLNFRRHMQAHKESIERLGNKFDCPHCKFPALSQHKLRCHVAKVHKLTMQGTTFTKSRSKIRIRKNSKWGKNLKNGMYQCHLCKSRYSHPETLKKHLKDHDKSRQELGGEWECDQCGYPALNRDSLQKHLTLKHGREQLKCGLCEKTFLKTALLTVHMRSHRQKEKYLDPQTGMLGCKQCDFQTKSLNGLRGHQRIHEEIADVNEKPHLCPQCGLSFTTKNLLRTHVQQKHEGVYRFNCDQCGRGCDSMGRFQEHLKTHEKNRVISRDFVCDLCGARYQTHRALNGHRRKIHESGNDASGSGTPKKQHQCKWCGMVFQHKQFLTRHLPEAHADLYKFSCDLCTKSYISSSSLRLHQQISHPSAVNTTSSGDQRSYCEHCGKGFAHRHHVICHYRHCAEKRKMNSVKKIDLQLQ